jgi:hypothetical protein
MFLSHCHPISVGDQDDARPWHLSCLNMQLFSDVDDFFLALDQVPLSFDAMFLIWFVLVLVTYLIHLLHRRGARTLWNNTGSHGFPLVLFSELIDLPWGGKSCVSLVSTRVFSFREVERHVDPMGMSSFGVCTKHVSIL